MRGSRRHVARPARCQRSDVPCCASPRHATACLHSRRYKHFFRSIRNKYPAYRIAILYVKARIDAVFERVRKRGEETGRCIPDAEVRASCM